MSVARTDVTAPATTMPANTVPATTTAPRVTAPPGTGLVVIPGGTQSQSPKQPALPGPQNDGSDFYGLGAALALIVVAIFVVRKIVPLRRQDAVGHHPSQPPDEAPAPDEARSAAESGQREDARP